MSSSTRYPPPLQPGSTLYSTSPHQKKDKTLRKRYNSTSYTDPFHVIVFILLVSLFCIWKPNLIPFSSKLGITSLTNTAKKHRCSCSIEDSPSSMVWQKTFTLPSASRGCHLITSQVEKEISEGLKGCKVCVRYKKTERERGHLMVPLSFTYILQAGLLTLFIQHTSASLTINENFDPE